MATNDKIILDEVLKQRKAEIDPASSESEFFELFAAEQVLKDHDLSYDEIEFGLIGSGGDGGIDSIYLFVNGELVQEDPDYSYLKKNVSLELVIIQAKTTAGFQETPVERFITVSEDIFDLSKDTTNFADVYNEGLIEAIDRFRVVHQQLAAKFPTLLIRYVYACKGTKVETSVERKVEKLQAVVQRHFPAAEFSFSFVGASELLALARKTPQTSYSLALAENPISSEGQVGFVCLVRVRDYHAFITDAAGNLRRQIFEANVRDYQGRTEVNEEIQQSLQKSKQEDFWWLNNGVTVIAGKATQSGKALTIEDPQIVNGLQTSTEVYNYCKKFNTDDDTRKILVRVIVPTESASRDRIIKATNSQTSVQQASLRATDKIHRDIEEYLKSRGLFYDRRKNYYKNEGKPRDKIIGIPHMAQAVMSILNQRPDTARARPSSLLKKDDDYRRVYNDSYPIQIYYVCIELVRRVEAYLKANVPELETKDRNNIRYYVAMHVAAKTHGAAKVNSADLAKLDLSKIRDPEIAASTAVVRSEYTSLGGSDKAAKGADLLPAVKAKL